MRKYNEINYYLPLSINPVGLIIMISNHFINSLLIIKWNVSIHYFIPIIGVIIWITINMIWIILFFKSSFWLSVLTSDLAFTSTLSWEAECELSQIDFHSIRFVCLFEINYLFLFSILHQRFAQPNRSFSSKQSKKLVSISIYKEWE